MNHRLSFAGPIPLRFFVVAALFLTGCATLAPPVEAPTGDPAPRIDPISATPDGLEFALTVPGARPGESLEIWRREDQTWTRLETIDVDSSRAEALTDGRARWRDDLDEQPRRLAYRIRLPDREATPRSAPVNVDWKGWLQAPEPAVEAPDTPEGAVRVDWRDAPALEARILRRDVIADADYRPVAIVAPAAGNEFVDDDLRPGGVYVYRIQFVDRRNAVPRKSRFVESAYVSIPEAPDSSRAGSSTR